MIPIRALLLMLAFLAAVFAVFVAPSIWPASYGLDCGSVAPGRYADCE